VTEPPLDNGQEIIKIKIFRQRKNTVIHDLKPFFKAGHEHKKERHPRNNHPKQR
jgi:hypothetical protein